MNGTISYSRVLPRDRILEGIREDNAICKSAEGGSKKEQRGLEQGQALAI